MNCCRFHRAVTFGPPNVGGPAVFGTNSVIFYNINEGDVAAWFRPSFRVFGNSPTQCGWARATTAGTAAYSCVNDNGMNQASGGAMW
jgi:hypothetical protein